LKGPEAVDGGEVRAVVGLRWRFVADAVLAIWLPLWFVIYDALVFDNLRSHGFLSVDVAVYREAAQRVLSGGDPWAAQAGSLAFAGPPPSLLPYLPTALLPLPVAVVVVTGVLLGAAAWTVRRLELPLWWILFPPVFESVVVGNPDVLVLALLLVRGPGAGLAAVVKIYALVPLVLQRRWRAIAVGLAVASLTLPLWPAFLANLPAVMASLAGQSEGFSAWGTWFMVPTLLALWVLRRRDAAWLAVPAIWPHTQIHYGAMSLPVLRRFPIAAAIVGLGTPLAAPLAIVIVAIQSRWRPSRSPDGSDAQVDP
jgi:hypothetical protein